MVRTQDNVSVDEVLTGENVTNVVLDFSDFLIARNVTVTCLESNLSQDYYLVVIRLWR